MDRNRERLPLSIIHRESKRESVREDATTRKARGIIEALGAATRVYLYAGADTWEALFREIETFRAERGRGVAARVKRTRAERSGRVPTLARTPSRCAASKLALLSPRHFSSDRVPVIGYGSRPAS